jgi:hypothetical protein
VNDFLLLVGSDPVENGVKKMGRLLVLHRQLLDIQISAMLLGDGCLLRKAFIKFFDEVFVLLKKLGHSHKCLDGSYCGFILLFPLIEKLLNIVVLIGLLDDIDEVLTIAIELGGGHCHFNIN